MNTIPSDLVVLDCAPKDLVLSDLQNIIYSDWYEVVEGRIGVAIAISPSKLEFPIQVKLLDLEDKGFSFKNCKIEKVPNDEKKWNNNEFYTTLSRKFNKNRID